MKQRQCVICNQFFSPNSNYQKFCFQCKEKAYQKNALKRAVLYYQKNKDKVLQYRKNYYRKNKEKILAQIKEYRKKYPQNKRKWAREYRKKNLKRLREYTKKYREKNPEWCREIWIKYRHRKKEKMIKFKGGKCSCCGITYNGKNACIFQFHHKNPKEKENKVERGINVWRKWEILVKELEKCDLVCANCHFLIHFQRSV